MNQTPDQRFAACFPITEAWEGWHVFTNDPHDPGGATWCGFTQGAYDAYRHLKGLPVQPVRNASDTEIKDCFRHQYWDAIRGDDLPPGLDLTLYDPAINSGPSKAIKFLQEALGVTVDGWFGLETLNALQKNNNLPSLIHTICTNRASFYHALTTFWRYGKGWLNRGNNIEAQALTMASLYLKG